MAAIVLMWGDVERKIPGELTSRFDLRKEGSHLLALHDVSDDMTRYFGVGAVCNDHWGATLQSPEGSFDLQENAGEKKKCSPEEVRNSYLV